MQRIHPTDGQPARVLAAAVRGVIPSLQALTGADGSPKGLDFDAVGLTDPVAGLVRGDGAADGAPLPHDFDAERPADDSAAADLGVVLGQTWQHVMDDHPLNRAMADLLPPPPAVAAPPPRLVRVRAVPDHGLLACDLADDRGRIVDTRFGHLTLTGQAGGFAKYCGEVDLGGGPVELVVFTDPRAAGLAGSAGLGRRLAGIAALLAGLLILLAAAMAAVRG